MNILIFIATYISLSSQKLTNAPFFYNTSRPLVISHRGAFGFYPEHSVGGYTNAYFYGVDYIELDLQITKDNVLVVNHDPCLKETTNARNFDFLFSDRLYNNTFYPYNITYTDDYLIKDFTLEEIKMFRRKQRFLTRNPYFNSEYQVQTLDEVIGLVLQLNQNFPQDKLVGLYIETKMYQFYLDNYQIDISQLLFDNLKKYNIHTIDTSKDKLPIIIECFEAPALIKFSTLSDLPLVQLMFWNNPLANYSLQEISKYAHGVGPYSDWLFYYKPQLNSTKSTFIEEAHVYDLAVHPWVLRDDQLIYSNNPITEHLIYLDIEIDGIFTEFPHTTTTVYNYYNSTNKFPHYQQKFLGYL